MKRGLIVIDMLEDFVREDGKLFIGPTGLDIIPKIKKRLNKYRSEGRPVIFLKDSHKINDLEFDLFPEHAVEGTIGAEIIAELKPLKDESVVNKTRYSGFFETSLDIILYPHFSLSPSNSAIELCGVCTHICVMDTCGGLANRDYKTVIHKDCVADFDQIMHEMSLKRMADLYGATIV